jgi:chloride channel protein, CIC family
MVQRAATQCGVDRLLHVVGTAVAAIVVGAMVGALTALGAYLAIDVMLSNVRDLPAPVMALVPLFGLAVVAVIVRLAVSAADPDPGDEFIYAVARHRRLNAANVAGRVAAAIAGVGSGCALGLDVPATYLGGAMGELVSRRSRRLFLDPNLLMVAGAAAALAGLLGHPAVGALFVVEVGYRVGLDLRRLPVALLGAMAGFGSFRLVLETPPLIAVRGFQLNTRVVVVAVVAGILGGLLATALSTAVRQAREASAVFAAPLRVSIAGVTVAVVFYLSRLSDVDGLTLGPGGAAMGWALDPSRPTGWVLMIGALLLIAVPVCVAGGGVGGLVVPTLAIGALAGRAVAGPVAPTQLAVVAVLAGGAAVAAAYRVPLTSLALVVGVCADARAVIPAIVAVGIATLATRGVSISQSQRPLPKLVRVPVPTARGRIRASGHRDGDLDDLGADLDVWDP